MCMCDFDWHPASKPTSPTSMLHGNAPVSLHHSSSTKLPVGSPPTQEDLWHLPGRLRESLFYGKADPGTSVKTSVCVLERPAGINPSLWDKEDVAFWLHWAQKEYSLRRPEKGRFEMNGRALCLLTKEDFRRRCPSSGKCACTSTNRHLLELVTFVLCVVQVMFCMRFCSVWKCKGGVTPQKGLLRSRLWTQTAKSVVRPFLSVPKSQPQVATAKVGSDGVFYLIYCISQYLSVSNFQTNTDTNRSTSWSFSTHRTDPYFMYFNALLKATSWL